MDILIKNARVMDAQSPWKGKRVNIKLNDGIIEDISEGELNTAQQVIEGQNLCVSTGWLDMRAHFCDPGEEHKEDLQSGSLAAAAGGFTQVLLMPNTKPVIQDKNDVHYIKYGNPGRVAQLLPCAAVTHNTEGSDLTEMIDLHTAGAVAFSDGLEPLWNSDILLKTLLYLQKFDGLLIDRPEDKWLSMFGAMGEGYYSTMLGLKGIPPLSEETIVERNLKLLTYGGGKIHLSCLSTKEGVELVRKAKKAGLNVTADVAIANLLFEDQALIDFDTNYKVKPVLRTEQDRMFLIEGLKDGTIDAIVSNHVPQDEDEKKVEFDAASFGMSSIETVLPALLKLSGQVSMDVLLDKLTFSPREVLKLGQPVVAKGEVANLSIFDVDQEWVYKGSLCRSKSSNSPFYGKSLKGKILATINGRNTFVENNLKQ